MNACPFSDDSGLADLHGIDRLRALMENRLAVAANQLDGLERNTRMAYGIGVNRTELEVEARDRACCGGRIRDRENGLSHLGGVGCRIVRYGLDLCFVNVDDGNVDAVERSARHDSCNTHLADLFL
jgi:hypothetical protein